MPVYEPKILYNPKSEPVEFMLDHKVIVMQPGEHRNFDGFAAYHALVETNTGLVEYEGQSGRPGGIDYASLPWRKLVQLAALDGIHLEKGMNKEALIKKLEELDEQEAGVVPESTSEEEAERS